MDNQKDLNKELDSFLEPTKAIDSSDAKVVISDKAGLFERVDKKLVLEDGRQLLNERVY